MTTRDEDIRLPIGLATRDIAQHHHSRCSIVWALQHSKHKTCRLTGARMKGALFIEFFWQLARAIATCTIT